MNEAKARQTERSALPLSGLRVVDASRLLPGPWCTQMLADMGAEIIKIEQPGIGDPARHNPPYYRNGSVYFNSVNRGKRSIALDLAHPQGQQIARQLIAGADVMVESYRRGVTKRLGIDAEAVHALNPRLIYCSITGFGQSGPLAPIPGHDLVIQAMTGVMGTHPVPGVAPPVPGFQAADYAGAAYALSGILAALLRREKTGEGCTLDISMFDSLFSMSNIVLTGAMSRAGGGTGEPNLEVWGANPRYANYACRDGGAVAVSLLEMRAWQRFCTFIGRPELISDDETEQHRHSTHGDREELYRTALENYFMEHNRDDAVRELLAVDIAVCPVLTPDEALAGEHVAARGMVEWRDVPNEGRIPQIGNPLAASGLTNTHLDPAPDLGGNCDDILAELGYSAEDQAAFHRAGVFG